MNGVLCFTKREKKLFIFSFLFAFIIGVIITYSFNFENIVDFFLQSDTGRIIGDMTDPLYNHHRLNVHPLFVLITEPVYFILNGFFNNKMMTLIMISALVTSFAIIFLYKILSFYSDNSRIKTIVCLLYLFSFSNYIYTAGMELYNMSALALIMLWYFGLKCYNTDKNQRIYLLYLGIIGVFIGGITISNIMIFMILIFLLCCHKKIDLNTSVTAIFVVLLAISLLSHLQFFFWHNTPVLGFNSFGEERGYTKTSVSFTNFKNVFINDYYYAFIGNDVHLIENEKGINNAGDYLLVFNTKSNVILLIAMSCFYGLTLILLIRNYKKNKFINAGILISLLFNTTLHLFYGNNDTFLYSMHFLYLIILLMGINLCMEENKKLVKGCIIYIVALILLELAVNSNILSHIFKITMTIVPCNYLIANLGFDKYFMIMFTFMIVVAILVASIYILYKRSKQGNDSFIKIRYYIIIFVLCLLVYLMFFSLGNVRKSKSLWWIEIKTHESTDKYLDPIKYLVK